MAEVRKAQTVAKYRGEKVSEDDLIAKTHPGFTITCDECKSTRVYVYNDTGWSPDSGSWGSIDLVCANCNSQTEIAEAHEIGGY